LRGQRKPARAEATSLEVTGSVTFAVVVAFTVIDRIDGIDGIGRQLDLLAVQDCRPSWPSCPGTWERQLPRLQERPR
jgi:hypothetical protein